MPILLNKMIQKYIAASSAIPWVINYNLLSKAEVSIFPYYIKGCLFLQLVKVRAVRIKVQVATKDLNYLLGIPHIACPVVSPLLIRVPNPTSTPPKIHPKRLRCFMA